MRRVRNFAPLSSTKCARIDAVQRLKQRKRDEPDQHTKDEYHRWFGESDETLQDALSALLAQFRGAAEEFLELARLFAHGNESGDDGRKERSFGDSAMQGHTVVYSSPEARDLLLRNGISNRREHILQRRQQWRATLEEHTGESRKAST